MNILLLLLIIIFFIAECWETFKTGGGGGIIPIDKKTECNYQGFLLSVSIVYNIFFPLSLSGCSEKHFVFYPLPYILMECTVLCLG